MNFNTPRAARAFLLIALPLSAVAAIAQGLPSSITSFDKEGNPIIQATSGDPNRSSVTSFDKQGNPVITYTSPPVLLNGNNTGTAPNPNPPIYNRFGYSTSYPNGYNNYNYPPGYGYPNQGYPIPGYGYPAYPVQNNAYTIPLGQPPYSWSGNNSISVIPLNQGYAYPAPYPYPVPPYGYPVPAYNYPTGYGNPYGYGYGNGSYSSNSTGYGVTFGRGGFSASIGGSNTTSRSSTTITVR